MAEDTVLDEGNAPIPGKIAGEALDFAHRIAAAGLGVSAAPAPARSRGYPARQCLDWTERQHHLGGPLGVDLLTALCAHGWLRRSADSRALQVTPPGAVALREALGVDVDALRNAGSVAV